MSNRQKAGKSGEPGPNGQAGTTCVGCPTGGLMVRNQFGYALESDE